MRVHLRDLAVCVEMRWMTRNCADPWIRRSGMRLWLDFTSGRCVEEPDGCVGELEGCIGEPGGCVEDPDECVEDPDERAAGTRDA